MTGMPGGVLDWFHRAARDPLSAARAAAAAGRKVVATLGNAVPAELIRAAGALPVRIHGDPSRPTEIGDRYMEEIFDGTVRSVFDRLLRGEFGFTDLLVIPRSSEGTLQLYYYLLEAKRREPQLRLPELHLFDLLQTPYSATGRYDRDRMDDLHRRLEVLAGRPIPPTGITAEIHRANGLRRQLARLGELRRASPPRLAGSDMLAVLKAVETSDITDASAHVDALLAAELPALTGPRLMVKGSPQDDGRFYRLVESLGMVVVADDHETGEPVLHHAVDESDDPLQALAEHYQLHVPTLRTYPQARADRWFADRVRSAAVDGVIFYLEQHDDALGWDVPAQRAMLDKAGIPSVVLVHQNYRRPDQAAQRTEVQGLLASIAAREPAA